MIIHVHIHLHVHTYGTMQKGNEVLRIGFIEGTSLH